MNFVFLNPIGRVGGAERVLLDVVSALLKSADGHSVTVILLSDGPLVQVLREYGAEVVVEPLPEVIGSMGDSQLISGNRLFSKLGLLKKLTIGSAGLVSFTRRLTKRIKLYQPDILYSNGLKTHLLSALVKPRKAKLVWHLHDFYGARPAVARVLAVAAKRVNHAVAISHAIEADMHQLASQLPITVIYNAVDGIKFTPNAECTSGSELDRLAGLELAPASVIRFGLVATYANWKGHLTFLDAFATAKQRVSVSLRAYLIGGPIYSTAGSQVTEAELRQRIEELGIEAEVGLIAFQADTSAIYQMLDVVVHASTRPEPFGLTIAEAMSCGRAVIISAGGGAKELFTEGFDGLGHAPGDASQLAEAMVRLGDDADLRQRLAQNACQSSRMRFSQQRFGEELIRMLDFLNR